METKKLVCVLFGFLASTMMLVAEVKFDPIFVDGMVIQQNQPIRIFGTESVEGVKIKISLGNRKETVVPDEDGKWEIILKPLKGSFKKLTLKSETRYKNEKSIRYVNNIYIGDVWLAGGGTNMDLPLSSYTPLKTELAEVDNSSLKFTGIRKTGKPAPNTLFEIDYAFKKRWQAAKAGEYLDAFSPVAYHFAAPQTVKSKFPVGIIECAAPNAVIESWIPKEEYLEAGFREKTIKGKAALSSSQYYNGMIHPLTKLKYKGVIWYHGIENSHNPEEYGKLFQTLIESWRKRFENPEMYFFYAQTSSYKGSPKDKSGKSLAWIREAQAKALKLPNTGMVVTTDLGIQ
ncbi:MAG: sialate O-acetylesterase, partial [Lentisphaeraceae bacterium]|nr:sialate O-acetylesterase [Lentisphaeraceae bacterium]